MTTRTAVVTGASSGIGAATARRLAAAGFHVVLTARREDRIKALAAELTAEGHRATAHPLDVTDRAAVDAFAAALDAHDSIDVLVNNAGGAIGTETVATADPADWRAMYEVNVLGVLNVTQALLPRLVAAEGTVVVLSSTAALATYEGAAATSPPSTARTSSPRPCAWNCAGSRCASSRSPPGMVKTEGFAVTRFRGDEEKAAAVYAGVAEPLDADDVADTVTWAVTRPAHVNVDLLVLRPRAQASNYKVHRES
ncbi:SDR family NAD(P)-dependent oxidoreductase [Streptomyces olivoverticillatus]